MGDVLVGKTTIASDVSSHANAHKSSVWIFKLEEKHNYLKFAGKINLPKNQTYNLIQHPLDSGSLAAVGPGSHNSGLSCIFLYIQHDPL